MSLSLDLQTVWFVLVGVLFAGYAMLDGFDLGVGGLHLFAETDAQRRTMLNAIGPVWDGNEVWLVTGGGALFAAFPEAYATAFSGFYLAFMGLLWMLIFRAVSIEFRSKRAGRLWRGVWDVGFSVSSVVSALLIGVALGNLVWGMPLGANHEYVGTFMELLRPYALLVGVMAVAWFMMHGAIYLVLKTEGPLHEKARTWVSRTMIFFIVMYGCVTLATLVYAPHMVTWIRQHPILFVVPILSLLAIANIPREIHHGHDFRAFLSSCAAMVGLMGTFAIGVYPYMIRSNPVVENSLTIYSAASSTKTLTIMLIIAAIGMPLVIAYTLSIYWIFRGKVQLGEGSY